MTDSAELVVKVRADASSLASEMKKAENVVTGSTKKMEAGVTSLASSFKTLIPAIGVAALIGFAKSAVSAADKLNDLSQRTGVAASTLSALNIPLKQGGSSVDEFAASINKMNNMIGEASKGQSQDLIDTFNHLGLSIEKLMQLTPEQQFYEIATALNKIQNQAEFTNTGMAIFGRSFSSIAPLIRQSNGELDKFVANAKAGGEALTEEQLKRIDDFGDKWTEATEKLKLSVVDLTTPLLSLIGLLDKSAQAAQSMMRGVAIASLTVQRATGAISKDVFDEAVLNARTGGAASYSLGKTVNEATFTPSRAASSGSNAPAKKSGGAKSPYEMTAGDVNFLNQAAEAAESKTRAEKEAAEATKKAADATERFNEVITNKLSTGLTQAIFTAGSAGDAFKRMAQSIAESIFEQSVARPLASGVSSAISNSGIGSGISSFFGNLLPSFDVGSNNIPNDMVAQVHKGEMIIPAAQAAQMRNGNGGGGVVVQQTFTINAGVSAEVRNQVAQAAPLIANAAKDAVFMAIQSGGSASKIVGVR